ncbi:hypothetical protein F5Y19DRAFT_486221 [Xylariaceae sp. FL1651]|nr:hypothetical protein F5Y19DRAFT_486221 [Xylariaceae sp. FL1651]
MPTPSHSVWLCCQCGDGPLNVNIIDCCPSCFHARCKECRCGPVYQLGLSKKHTGAQSSEPRISEFKEAEQPIRDTKEPLTESSDKSSTSIVDSHLLDRDAPWNPFSSNRTSQASSRLASSVQSIIPHNQQTFAAVLPQSRSSDWKESQVERTSREKAIEASYKLEAGSERSSQTNTNNVTTIFDPRSLVLRPGDATGSSSWERAHIASEKDDFLENHQLAAQDNSSDLKVDYLTAHEVDHHRSRLQTEKVLSAIDQEPLYTLTSLIMSGSHAEIGETETYPSTSGKGQERTTELPRDFSAEDSLDHLETVFRRLNLQQDKAYYSIIHQAYNEFRKCASGDAGVHNTQETAAARSGDGEQSSKPSYKRTRSQSDESDSDSEKNTPKKLKPSKTRSHGLEPNLQLACPFHKANPFIYSACAQFKGWTISKLGAHLRTAHTGKYHCRACCKTFNDDRQRAAHLEMGHCRPTRGPPVSDILPISKTKGRNEKERWYWIWSKLFPSMRAPEIPWQCDRDTYEQVILSFCKRIRNHGEALSSSERMLSLMEMVFSEWQRFPPEHLPDLREALLPEMGKDESGKESKRPSRPPEASSRPVSLLELPNTMESTFFQDSGAGVVRVTSVENEESSTPYSPQDTENLNSSSTHSIESLTTSPCTAVTAPAEDSDVANLVLRQAAHLQQISRENTPSSTSSSSTGEPDDEIEGPIAGTNDSLSDFLILGGTGDGESLYNMNDFDNSTGTEWDIPPTTATRSGEIGQSDDSWLEESNSGFPSLENGMDDQEQHSNINIRVTDASNIDFTRLRDETEPPLVSYSYDSLLTESIDIDTFLRDNCMEEPMTVVEGSKSATQSD